MKWRWLAVVGLLLPLSGCVYIDNTCPFPGATQTGTCYYFLHITKTPQKKTDGSYESYEVRGRVADGAVEKNRMVSLGWLGIFKAEDYKFTDYHFFEYPIPLDKSVAVLLSKDEERWFVSKAGTDHLDPYIPATPEGLKKLLEDYPSTKPWDSPTAR